MARVAGILANLYVPPGAFGATAVAGLRGEGGPGQLNESGSARYNVENSEHRTKVTILTGTYRVKGSIELVQGARVTDYLIEAKEFIAVTDAEVRDLNDRHIISTPFLNVSREHIQVLAPQ